MNPWNKNGVEKQRESLECAKVAAGWRKTGVASRDKPRNVPRIDDRKLTFDTPVF